MTDVRRIIKIIEERERTYLKHYAFCEDRKDDAGARYWTAAWATVVNLLAVIRAEFPKHRKALKAR
jgi:hypothetical protein